MERSLVIWQFCDGKPGHENQAKGLINAMAKRTQLTSHQISIPKTRWAFFVALISGRFFKQLNALDKPDFLIAAGNRTHLAMLIAKLFFGGKCIVLMRSNWPINWFDYAIIPQHDKPKPRINTLITHGVINLVEHSHIQDKTKGIILIGGPSKHYHWDSKFIIEQIQTIVSQTPQIAWTIANSRRTPDDFFMQLQAVCGNIDCIDHQQTSSDWLPNQLATSGIVWVSPDSVSMIYEAITSGASVGSLSLNKTSDNRIINGIEQLHADKMLTRYQQWYTQHLMLPPAQPLNEAQRAADWVLS